MKIAIPTAQGKLCAHFGHCEQFAIVTAENGQIQGTEFLAPPPHEPGACRAGSTSGASLASSQE